MRVYLNMGVILMLLFAGCSNKSETAMNDQWTKVDSLLGRISTPVFPDKEFSINDFGAVADGVTMNTEAINNAITACNDAGGGMVIIPQGKYLTGSVHLKSNVNLHLNDNAVLLFSTNPKDYLPVVLTRWEGIDCYNYSPLIYAYDLENIAITGKGTLDGQATEDNWWSWKGRSEYGWEEGMHSQSEPNSRPRLKMYNENQTPVKERVFGDGYYLRPQLINIYKCRNILLEDITLTNSPFWIIHPLLSENLTVRGIKANSNGPNTDGCDPESCKDVLIEDCYFNTGDDCIAIKSGRNQDGRRWNVPSQNIIVQNCKMQNGHGGVVMGSEISGGVNHVFVRNCVMNSPMLDRAIRIKTNSYRGGIVEDIFVRDVEVGQVGEAALRINCSYENPETEGKFMPVVRNVYIDSMTVNKAEYAFYLEGIKGEDCVYNINVTNSVFENVKKENIVEYVNDFNIKNVTINDEQFTVEKLLENNKILNPAIR